MCYLLARSKEVTFPVDEPSAARSELSVVVWLWKEVN
jgi:hypothetical protein